MTDHQWCGGYHRILSWTLPSDMCAHGNIEQTGGAARAGVDFNSSLIGNVSYTFGGVRRAYDRHKLCATGSKRVYISTYTDSHDEGEETAELTFVVSEVVESGKRSKTVRPSDVAVTPGTLVITNDGPLPGGYLAELGHTVAEHLTRTIAERAAARREAGHERNARRRACARRDDRASQKRSSGRKAPRRPPTARWPPGRASRAPS